MKHSRPIGETIDRYLDEVAQAADLDRLQEQLQESAQAADAFVEAVFLDTLLQSAYSEKSHAIDAVFGQASTGEETLAAVESFDIPSLTPLPSPLSPSFVGGPVFSYMVATVVLCLMLLGAWAYKISHITDSQVVNNSRRSTICGPLGRVYVGRITGMKDCRWAVSEPGVFLGSATSLGREYSLASGLLEITYNNGAKVILEGPCTYRVDSDAGGFLARGKLTARVETKGAGFGGQGSGFRGQRSEERGQKTHPSSLFSVRTPTALVTDLGTEFGVEVAENGDTTSYVFQGSIKVQGLAASAASSAVLHVNESIRVSRVRETHHEQTATDLVRFTHPTTSPKFVRRLYEPPKQLDLLDIVAGGDGTSHRRELGIDPSTGKQDTWLISETRISDDGYHNYPWSRFIDGVFIPCIKSRIKDPNVPLDSAGHIYTHFADHKLMDGEWRSNNLNGKTVGSIWARAADIDREDKAINTSCWIYNIHDDKRYMPEGRGLLGLHANVGITFDLDAMRNAFDDVRPARLRATAGLADGPRKYEDAIGAADLWIFLDGRLVWKRMYLRNQDGPIEVDVEIGPEDKFLTIVSTNCKFGNAYDWIVLGDPALEMVPENTKGQ